MKKKFTRLSAFLIAVMLIIAALPLTVLAANDENKSPFSNITCIFDRSSSKIKLEYRMKSEDVKKYANFKIDLYAIAASQTIYDIPSLEPKLTGLSPSNRASVEVRYEGLYDRLSAYVFVMKTDDGLICSEPILPQVDSTRADIPFKGIETSSTALTVGTVAGTVILDINTDSLISNGSGYLYPTTGYTYTFSSTYLDNIDDLIMLYRGAGRRILFRIVPGARTAEIFSGKYENQRSVYACVSFLYSRYATEKFGGINGFILGTDEQTKPELAEKYANTLYAAAAGLDDLDVSCPLIVPVSEDIDQTISFLDALVAELGDSPMFTLMLQSKHSPYNINDDYITELEDNADAASSMLHPSDSASSYISVENLTRLTRLIERKYKSSVYQNIIYNWTPSENVTGEAAIAAYVYNYLALSQLGQIASFVISPSEKMEKKFIDAVKYINTDLREEFIDNERILSLYRFDSWEQHFDRYDPAKLSDMIVKNKQVHTGTPPRFIGTVDYFDFSSSTDLSGWYAGQNCSGIYSDTTDFGKSFNAEFTFPDDRISGGAFVSYTYRYSESFKYTDYIAIELSIGSNVDKELYDVTVSIGGNGFIYDYTAESIISGTLRTLYIDVREFDESMITDYLRITVEPHDGGADSADLCLYSVTANSLKYNSDRLKNHILSERERLKSDDSVTLGAGATQNVVVFLSATLIVTALVMLTISRQRKRKRLNGEDNE